MAKTAISDYIHDPTIGLKKNCSLQGLFAITDMHPLLEKSKLYLGLKTALISAVDVNDIKAALLGLCSQTEEDILTVLHKHPDILDDMSAVEVDMEYTNES